MIDVSLEYETDWIVKGTITSDLDYINLKNENFRIEIMDLLEHYIKDNNTSAISARFEKDKYPLLSISNQEYITPTDLSGYVACVMEGGNTANYLKDWDLVLSSTWDESIRTSDINDAYVFPNTAIANTILNRLDAPQTRTFSAYPVSSYTSLSTEIYESNIEDYNNSDTIHLIRNGFQFWISDNKLIFRMTVRGHSTLNTSGYYDKVIGSYTNKVGFCLAYCVVSLDATHKITFKVPIAPKFKSSDIFRAELETDVQVPTKPYRTCPICTSGILLDSDNLGPVTCPACNGTGSGYYQDRYGYPYNNSLATQNMLFVNNNTNTYSADYSTVWNNRTQEYNLSSTFDSGVNQVPIYQVITSAIIPSYLIDEDTVDLLTNEEVKRNLYFNESSSSISSVLMSDDKTYYCDIPYTCYPDYHATAFYILENYEYVTATTGMLYGDLSIKLIKQTISSNEPDIKDKTVMFKMEI